ncbi:MAG: hypothetical protein IK127_06045 [Clostridia bacterium]|nr:hypothetical protein [Clostridia bacterium]
MKKWLSILLAAILMMTVGFALTEDEPIDQPAPNPDLFSGTWACDRAVISINWEEEGYRILIQWGSSAWECTEWEYSCYFHEEENKLVSMPFGTRTEMVYGEDGDLVSATVVYDDGEATFYLDEEGFLIWADEKENAGEGMRFELLPEIEEEDFSEG